MPIHRIAEIPNENVNEGHRPSSAREEEIAVRATTRYCSGLRDTQCTVHCGSFLRCYFTA